MLTTPKSPRRPAPPESHHFYLTDNFIHPYQTKTVPWGFGDMSYVTFKRTYARDVDGEDRTEEWFECCRRVIEFMFTAQKHHCLSMRLPWDEDKARRFAQKAYDRLFHFKWTPAGRGLRMAGTDFVFTRSSAPLNSCAFVSTADIDKNFSEPFGWLLEMSMLGVGVGFDTKGMGKQTLVLPHVADEVHVVEDSREGWRCAVEVMLSAYVGDCPMPVDFDCSFVRKKGATISSFGGVASGPEPLLVALKLINRLCSEYIGRPVDSRFIVDVMNIIGKCVVAGGVRRTAEIAFGQPGDLQFLDLKLDMEKLQEYRWASNNSVFAHVGMDYSGVAERTGKNGEPGYFWLENARAFGRMKDPANWDDENAIGANPCNEQTLWNKELCNLVETYPTHHDDLEDYKETLRVAYQYAKTVTLLETHDPNTNAVMMRNRRIGCSMTGIIQAINKHGYRELFQWCDEGYKYIQHLDKKYSDWLCIPRSIKTTSIKPSGTVSLLAGATPGCHWEHSLFYIRRMRVPDSHELVEICREAGYHVEEAVREDDTMVISFPVKVDNLKRTKQEVSIWEKVDLAAQLQYYWADNQVSCTAEFDPETEAAEIPRILEAYENRLKGISFLPAYDLEDDYPQLPYEPITKEEYEAMAANIVPIKGNIRHDSEDKFCSGTTCLIDQ